MVQYSESKPEHDDPSEHERSLTGDVKPLRNIIRPKKGKNRRRDGNEAANDGTGKTEFLAIGVFAEQSERRAL